MIVKDIIRAASKVGAIDTYSSIRSRFVKQKVVIVAYHQIDWTSSYPWSMTPVTPDVFELEMKYLKQNFEVISLDELGIALRDNKPVAPNTAVVTIDDGYRDIYKYAYPVFKKYGIPATVFLTTGHVGEKDLFWWDKVRYVFWMNKHDKLDLDEFGTHLLNSPVARLRAAESVMNEVKQIVPNTDALTHLLESRSAKSSGVGSP